ncbi:hypothetical protein GLIP_4112 [Aliiglaciecola lipolytica E3]|uniref:Uncharacterized protein n=1 Tax=Aliiglaciecola lipolytica E3 TaxID=1127673 RepID=K6YJD5_9ALTE|nr:hypothetical protein GLIP_4112 [Aliiglaciecola lipolytica E3]
MALTFFRAGHRFTTTWGGGFFIYWLHTNNLELSWCYKIAEQRKLNQKNTPKIHIGVKKQNICVLPF